LERARAKGYISEKQFGESIANITSQSSGGKAKAQWIELDSFPVSVTEGGTRTVTATKHIAPNGVVSFGVSQKLTVPDGTTFPKGFTPLDRVDNTVTGYRAMQKVAKAAEKAEQ